MLKKIVSDVKIFSAGVFAQSISGNVSSEDGPLPGATIVVKGTENGTSTDFDGNFTIDASNGDVLIVSFIGFETQEVAISASDIMDVTLSEGVALMTEIKKKPAISNRLF